MDGRGFIVGEGRKGVGEWDAFHSFFFSGARPYEIYEI
jgi:hypothetical protein